MLTVNWQLKTHWTLRLVADSSSSRPRQICSIEINTKLVHSLWVFNRSQVQMPWQSDLASKKCPLLPPSTSRSKWIWSRSKMPKRWIYNRTKQAHPFIIIQMPPCKGSRGDEPRKDRVDSPFSMIVLWLPTLTIWMWSKRATKASCSAKTWRLRNVES